MASFDPKSSGGVVFATTHWSQVLAAGDKESLESRQALEQLCAAYWYPLYAYIRSRCHDSQQAQDLTQEFFARFLEKDYLHMVDRQKGRFRCFLLACVRHFLSNECDREATKKRGGGRAFLSIDGGLAESRYPLESQAGLSPEKLFERRWAVALLEQALARLRQEFTSSGRSNLFNRLKVFLGGDGTAAPHEQLARELALSEKAVTVTIHRLRRRYRQLLREEIAKTVDEPAQVEDEIRDLFAAFARE